jgi:molybdopterin-guanine dinucleotide biosynthesis protein A
MYAIVTAGGIPEMGDPLYEFTQGKPKALLEIAGKPMVQWVLDAFEAAKSIEGVLLTGLGPDNGIVCSKPIYHYPNQPGMLENILVGVQELLRISPEPQHVVVSSSDIPALRGEMIDWLVDNASQTDHDLYYSVITRQVMEQRYPASKRTYIHLKDMVVCGGDMNMIHTRAVTSDLDFWRKVISTRKNPIKQASLIGFDTVFRLLVRQITLQQAVKNVARRVKLNGRALVCPYAEVAMDVDKPHQLEILRQDLLYRNQALVA